MDVWYTLYGVGPNYPLSTSDDNQAVSVTSGIIASALAFYEKDPARNLDILRWAISECPSFPTVPC